MNLRLGLRSSADPGKQPVRARSLWVQSFCFCLGDDTLNYQLCRVRIQPPCQVEQWQPWGPKHLLWEWDAQWCQSTHRLDEVMPTRAPSNKRVPNRPCCALCWASALIAIILSKTDHTCMLQGCTSAINCQKGSSSYALHKQPLLLPPQRDWLLWQMITTARIFFPLSHQLKPSAVVKAIVKTPANQIHYWLVYEVQPRQICKEMSCANKALSITTPCTLPG